MRLELDKLLEMLTSERMERTQHTSTEDANGGEQHGEQPEADKEEDMYSYCVETLLYPESATQAFTTVLRLLTLTFLELTFSFGFFDAGWMNVYRGTTNLLGGPVANSVFYPEASIAYAAAGNAVPTVQVLTSASGILLLTTVVHRDNTTSLRTMPPLVMLPYLLADGATSARRLWLVVACVLLHLEWCIRCLFLPVATLLGTALALASADSALDVVLNAVAVGFLYDLDSMAYATLLTPRKRRAYKARPSPLPARVNPMGELDAPFHWGFLCALIDATFSLYIYCVDAWGIEVEPPTQNEFWSFGSHLHCRGGVRRVGPRARVRAAHALMKPRHPPAASGSFLRHCPHP